MKNKNIKVKVVGNDGMEGMIEVKKFSGYEMMKSVVDELEGEGEMNKGRYKEDYKVVKENKDCIVVYGNEGVDWIKFIKV
jgi:hypothetical protein